MITTDLIHSWGSTMPTQRCDDLAQPDKVNFGVSLFIVFGILVSYLPQHYRIIARQSSDGISPYYILLGATSATATLANILVLPRQRADLECCRTISPFACSAAVLGILQVGVQWVCFFLIMLLYIIFFPRSDAPTTDDTNDTLNDTSDSNTDPANGKDLKPSYRHALTVVLTVIAHLLLTFLISLILITRWPQAAQSWANILGIEASCLASIQYLPQIATTWRLKEVRSLSIPMMCIQTPGAFVFAASLAARLGWEGWSVWLMYCVTGLCQGVLLGMAISFELAERRRRREEEGAAQQAVDGRGGQQEGEGEREPLLGGAH